ncbi:MAG: Arc family DNA-binding protein [Casimicrobiaceae bacterium]
MQNGTSLEVIVPVNLSIKNAPDDIVEVLKSRAVRHHRSLQGELMAIIEAAAREPEPVRLDAREVLARVRIRGTAGNDESGAIVRAARDGQMHDRRRR